jgi:predicted phage-related endonuclease
MKPPSELQEKYAAVLAEQAALKRRVAELTARKSELEQRLAESPPEQAETAGGDHEATNLEVARRAKGQPDPDARD